MTNILPKVTKRVFTKSDPWPLQFTDDVGTDWVTDRYAIIRRDAIRKASTFDLEDGRFKLNGLLDRLRHGWAREESVVSAGLIDNDGVTRYRLTDSTGETTSIAAKHYVALSATGATPRIIWARVSLIGWFDDDDNLVALVMPIREPKRTSNAAKR